MNRLVSVAFVSALLLAAMLMPKISVGSVRVFSSVHQGDLILNDNDVYSIEGRFDINGSILVEDNATLVLKNAIVNFMQASDNQFNMTFFNPANGNPRLEADNATFVSNYYFSAISFYGNSSASVSNLIIPRQGLDFNDHSVGSISSSAIGVLEVMSNANVSISDSSFTYWARFAHSSAASILNCSINELDVLHGANVSVSDCSINKLGFWGGGTNCSISNLEPGLFHYWNFYLNCSATGIWPNSAPDLTLKETQINEWSYFDLHLSNVTLTSCKITRFDAYDGSVLFAYKSEMDQLYCYGSVVSIFDSTVKELYGILRMPGYPTPEVRIYGNTNVSIYDSDLQVLDCHNSSLVRISGHLTMNGTIAVGENAELTLQDAVINFTQTEDWQFGIALANPTGGSPRLTIVNTLITSNHKYSVDLFHNSSATIYDSRFTALPGGYCWLWNYGSSIGSFHNVTLYGLSSTSNSGISVFESNITNMNIYGSCPANVYDSSIDTSNSYESSNITFANSRIANVQTFDSSIQQFRDSSIEWIYAYNKTSVWLTNSSFNLRDNHDQSRILVLWYLNVHVVDSIGQNVQSANVTATYPNATEANSKRTEANGWARLTLMEMMLNQTAAYPVGNYTVQATYLSYSNVTSVEMIANRQVTLKLENLVVAEFQKFIIPTLLIIAALLTTITYRRKHVKRG